MRIKSFVLEGWVGECDIFLIIQTADEITSLVCDYSSWSVVSCHEAISAVEHSS